MSAELDAANWQEHYRSFSEGLTEAMFHEVAAEDVRTELVAVDALVRDLGEMRPHLASTGTERYLAQIEQASGQLQEVMHLISWQMTHVSLGLSRQWPFIILILIF